MNLYLTILLLVFLLCLYGIILSFGINKKFLGVGLAILLTGIVLRYLSLFIYLISESPQFLFDIRNLILLSAVSIPLISYICIIKVNKGSISKLDLMIISVMAVVYFYIIIMSPERIVSDEIGYRLELKNNFVYYLSVIQGVFSIYMIYISTKYIFKTNLRKIKIINMMFFLGYILAIGEGIALMLNKSILKSPVISEAFLILAIIIALREIKNNKSTK